MDAYSILKKYEDINNRYFTNIDKDIIISAMKEYADIVISEYNKRNKKSNKINYTKCQTFIGKVKANKEITEIINIIDNYNSLSLQDKLELEKSIKYSVNVFIKTYPSIIRRDGKVGRFYRVKFNNYKEVEKSKEQTSKGVEDVDIDYYDNDNELPF